MPPRIARSSVQVAAPKTVRNKNRKRNLDAYAIASHSAQEKAPVKANRLGEYLDDGAPKPKRRRAVQTPDEAEEESVDEEVPAPKRRRKGQDEDVEEGSDSSGNEWTMGGLAEDDEDSDLDSDEAFGESDDEKFEGFTFRGSSTNQKTGKKTAAKKTKKGSVAVDENEEDDFDLEEGDEDEDEEDDFGDEGVDLATMLDDNDEDMLGDNDNTGRDMGEESASDDEKDEESALDADSEEGEDDGADEERNARMRDRLDALDTTGRKDASSAPQQPGQLTVDDLLETLDPASRKQYNAALKTGKKTSRPTTLSAPLPKRQQDRLDREVASKKAKEQLDRWRDTVIQNRRAEFLSFPLKDADRTEPMGKEKFTVDGKPQNELEDNIQKIMEESGMSANKSGQADNEEDALMKSEELETNKLPVEEVMRRRAELRRARELLFREEIKAKRIAKIKSKSYRRVHRKERERQRELEKGLHGDDENDKEAADRKRAEARMDAKHKGSKWAKALKETNRTVWDEGAREGVIDEARRREDLKKRIAGEDVSDDGASTDVSSDDGEGMDDEQDEDKSTAKQLDRLKQGDDGKGDGKKGLANLKFMRAADERRKAQNDEDVERLRKELAVQDGDEDGSEGEDINDQGLGRAVFGPKGKEKQEPKEKAKRAEMEEGDESSADEEDEQDVEVLTERPSGTAAKESVSGKKTTAASGPPGKTLGSDRRTAEQAKNDKSSAGISWLSAPLKSKKDRKLERTAQGDGAVIQTQIPASGEKKTGQTNTKATKNQSQQNGATGNNGSAGNTDGWTVVTYNDKNEDGENDTNEVEDPVLNKQQQKADYHRRAFAGDDVHLAFNAEKADLEASEDEKEEESNALPGWGSWTGAGLSKSIRRANKQRQKHNPLTKTKTPGTRPADRKDAGLENVIISEKSQRKGKGYMAPILPHGFETKEQYERSLRVPVGPEWTTKETFQRGTRPRVVVKPGTVVQPMDRPAV